MLDDDFVDRFATNWRDSGLSTPMLMLLEYLEKLTRQPSSCKKSDILALQTLGWSDEEIHDAVQVCSYFNYINRVAEGLGVDEEDWLDANGCKRVDKDAPTGS